ncbi:TrkA C-terminal domain-containing protein, partial [Bacillus tequilensis]|uniref:TrkA C-terminal domain-containing protein n=1 Tax=Bacillus tequilensis TaxID=227866 RepID=UPI0028409E3F
GNEDMNTDIAVRAKEKGKERVIASVRSPENEAALKEQGISIISILMSTKTLIRALIEAPGVMKLLTNQESSLYQINMENSTYVGVILREFPLTGDVISGRIFRGVASIVPHGDTRLKLGDRLMVSGSRGYVTDLTKTLEG